MADGKIKTESYQLMGGINSKASPYVNGPMEFRDISNMNFASPGALSKRPGTTLYSGATVNGAILSGYEFERLNGSSYIIATANTSAYTVTNSGYNAFKTGLLNNGVFSFVTFVDRLFACNGKDFFKYDGSSVENYSLPAGITGWGATAFIGGSIVTGLTGTFVTSWGFVNDRGFFGPVAPGVTVTLDGVTFNAISYYGLTTAPNYGITAISLFRTTSSGVQLTFTTFAPTSGATAIDIGFTLTNFIAPFSYQFTTLIPQYLSIFNNQMFMAGFSTLPSRVVWSEIGEPEAIDPGFDVELRTNDGDVITGLCPYNSTLIVTKRRSFHQIFGDNPENFVFQQISDQYGCISNRAIVSHQNIIWFLDEKGIVEYNGSNFSIKSNQIEPIFRAMNVDAAINKAVAVHAKFFNEVWFAIPINGSTTNNIVVVYDYLVGAWTHYDGLNIAALWIARGGLPGKTPMFGNYTGAIFNFGSSLMGDNGNGITCMFDSYFLMEAGKTIESMYRRFYLDVNPIVGVTLPIRMDFRSNFGTTIQATRTMYQNPYQSRVDFGISARSIQARMSASSASFPLVINGFTFEGRIQREV
jgi:hypothetical protein